MTKRSIFLLVILVALSLPFVAVAGVTLMWVDTSGSMSKNGRFKSARDVLIREIEEAKPGDVLYTGHFDTNDYLIGRLAVDESGSKEEKERIINKVRTLSAKGLWTNLDEPLQGSKAILLEERSPGKRTIIILSDGLSDPSPDHQPVDLAKIAEMVPQDLGWSVYLIGLSEDIEGLFQTKSDESEITSSPQYPHVKGIPLHEFTHDKIEDAVEIAKTDTSEVSHEGKDTQSRQPEPKQSPVVWPWLLGAFALTAISVPLLLVHRNKNKPRLSLILGIRVNDEEEKELSVYLEEGARKTAGPRGDIQVDSQDMELPHIIFTLLFKKGSLWLVPQDSVSVNRKLANGKIAISPGDLIKVRDKITILIKEGGDNDVTE